MNDKYNMKHARQSKLNWKILLITLCSIAVIALAFVIYLYFPIILGFLDNKVLGFFNGSSEPGPEIQEEVIVEDPQDDKDDPGEEVIIEEEEDPEPEDAADTETEEQSDEDQETEEDVEDGDEEKIQGTVPTIQLKIFEGPLYSSSDDICYYRIVAEVTGDPFPSIVFDKDDSLGSLGSNKAQVNITRESQSYTLSATAKNSMGTSSDSITLNWNCNRPPDIGGISLETNTPYINENYDIVVNVEDLDGDDLIYSWSTNGGNFSNAESNPTIWNTPGSPGDYSISVNVKDGIGNNSETSIVIYVGKSEPEPENVNLPRKENEGGYIEYGGSTNAGGNIFAGDSSSDLPCSGFVSFDITGIAGRTVESATLTFSGASISGDPLEFLDTLWINSLDWGAEPINQDDFMLAGVAIANYNSAEISCNVSKLKEELQKAINDGRSRFQIRIHFGGAYTDNDGQEDGWGYSQGNINMNASLN